jgi:tetratricopeptide (TPR) repeat protein
MYRSKKIFKCPNTDSFVIEGYDSDLFVLELNNKLEIGQPEIIEKPFSTLRETLKSIVDIDDDEQYKEVKEKLKISKKHVEMAIKQFEEAVPDEAGKNSEKIKVELFKITIISLIVNESYSAKKIEPIISKTRTMNNQEIDDLIAHYYFSWGNHLENIANKKTGGEAEKLYLQALEKFKTATEIKPDFHDAFNNWGVCFINFAKTKEGENAETIYQQSFEKFKTATEIRSDKNTSFYNWGSALVNLAETKKDPIEAELTYQQAFEKYQKATKMKPDDHGAFQGWGNAVADLAKTKKSPVEAESLYKQAFEKYKKAIEIKINCYETLYNWGTSLVELAEIKKNSTEIKALYEQAIEKYQEATTIKPDYHDAFYNWGRALSNLAEKTKDLPKAESLYKQAFEKYKKAIDIKPDKSEAIYNWGNALASLAKTKTGRESEELYSQALEKLTIAMEVGGWCYNLSCLYALRKNKKEALLYLEKSLNNQEVDAQTVKNDEDWKNYNSDKDFIELLNKYEAPVTN